MDYQIILGAIAAIIGIAALLPYFRDIILRRTKPHVFTWLIWSLLLATVLIAQIQSGAGPGAWTTGADFIVCFIAFLCAIFVGEKEIALIDKLSLLGALIGICFLVLVQAPLEAVILATIVDVFGFIPTYRKSLKKPNEETLTTYALSAISFCFALAALSSVTVTTALYPASLVITQGLFVIVIFFRRRRKTSGI